MLGIGFGALIYKVAKFLYNHSVAKQVDDLRNPNIYIR